MKNVKNLHANAQMEKNYKKYAGMTGAEVLAALNSAETGLTGEEAEKRLEQYGPNQVRSTKAIP